MTALYFFTLQEMGSFNATFKSTDGENFFLNYVASTVDKAKYTKVDIDLKWEHQSNKFISVTRVDEKGIPVNATNCKNIYVENDNSINFSYQDENPVCANVVKVVSCIPVNLAHFEKSDEPVAKKDEGPVTKQYFGQLSDDMKILLQSDDLKDVTLTNGYEKMRAHKLILSARSPVFAEMLDNSTEEVGEHHIRVEDISMEVLRKLLVFLYSGTVEIEGSKMARDLHAAAEKYKIQDLKNFCSRMMV